MHAKFSGQKCVSVKKITNMRYDGETTSNCSSFSGLKVEKSPLQWYVCGGKPVRWAKWPSASLILKQCECQEETIGCEKQIWKSIFTGKTWIFRKLKKKIDVYFAFKAILSILVFHEKFHFFLVGMTIEGPVPSWIDKILPPHLCTMCFITFLAIYHSKVCSGKIG